ncbi:hypothetical protein [Anaerotignum sp.]|uniref:hypothetical protein n=1 Tax=Anaerotignum sp. TaxID=2039241 RepID=UPI002714E934|nr:hypothetical protein [Anaerotignum sp.]
MKYQKKQEMKKKVLAIIALIMALIMILSLIAPFTIFAAPVTEVTTSVVKSNDGAETDVDDTIGSLESFGKDRFTVELQAGFDENYIVKKGMPVRGVVTNRGDAFHGEVQIKAYTRTSYANKEYAIYYQKLDLEQGASKSIDMEVTMGSIHEYLEISLVDAKGNKVYQDYSFLTAKDPNTIMIGVLSDSPQDLKYLNNLHLAQMPEDFMDDAEIYQNELSKNYDFPVFLDESTFPNTIGIMNSFSALVVDDFDFSVLTQAQKDALHQWVLEGGTLMVGTGVTAQKTLRGLDFLSDIKVADVTEGAELEGISGEVSLAQLSGERLANLSLENVNGIFSVVEEGKGLIVLSDFSLSAAPMAGQSATLDLLQKALKQAASQSFEVDIYGDDRYYNQAQYIAGDFPPFEMGSISLIIGAIIVYILITGPILYFILKKKDRREKGWIIIPIVAFVFMGLVFFLAQNSTYKNGIINTVSYVEMQEGSNIATAEIGMALKASGKGDVTFTSDEKIPLAVNLEEDHYYGSDTQKEKCAYRILCGDTTEVKFPDTSSWQTQYFNTQKSINLGGNIESTVVMKDGGFVGEIINHTNVDFYHVVLLFNGYLQDFGSLKAGETLEVNISSEKVAQGDQIFSNGYYYQEFRDKVHSGEVTRYEAYLKYMEQDMQNQFYDYQVNTDLIPVTFFGYSDTPILNGERKINGNQVLENNITMYQQDFPLELSKQEEFEVELKGIVDAPIKFDHYENDGGDSIYPFEDSDFYVEYDIPDDIRVDRMEIDVEAPNDELVPQKIELFNEETQEWDEVVLYERVSVEKYVGEDNVVKMRMHCLKERESGVPKLLIQGGGLFAGN